MPRRGMLRAMAAVFAVFGMTGAALANISGTVFSDTNRDGVQNGGEGGLAAGITVNLWIDSNGNFAVDGGEIISTTTTAADGSYNFSGIPTNTNYRVLVDTSDPDIPTTAHLYGTYRPNYMPDAPFTGAPVTGINFAFVTPQDIAGLETCAATGGITSGPNLLINGDFGTLSGSPAPGTNRGSGFGEVSGLDFAQSQSNIFIPNDAIARGGRGQYSVLNKAVPEYGFGGGWDQAPIWHGLAARGGSANNLMAMFNLSTSGETFYEATVNVSPNTLYELSGWFSNLSTLAFEQGWGGTFANPNVEFAIDRIGVDDDADGTVDEADELAVVSTSGELLPSNHAIWREASGLFNSGGATSIRVLLRNYAAGSRGNDLAVDELRVLACNNIDVVDRSDAPTSGTSYGEATHDVVTGYRLGATIDDDGASLASANADGDGADDDGITIPPLTQGQSATITASVVGAGGYLQGWIDWNGNGAFEAGEQVATNLQDGNSDGVIDVSVTPPVAATSSQTFARFRWSTTPNLTTTADATDGEVEDYALTVAAGMCSLVVTSTADSGTGTLRDAILCANGDPAKDAITFNIAGAGVQTIVPLSPLPAITDDGISIDGSTQPGATCGTTRNAAGAITDRAILIALDGTSAGSGATADGLSVGAADSVTIKGMSIGNFDSDGINTTNSTNFTPICNHIGLAPDGITTRANNDKGIVIDGVTGGDIGDGTISGMNVIGSNSNDGIWLENTIDDVIIDTNYIGIAADGFTMVGNGRGYSGSGISFSGWTGNIVSDGEIIRNNVIASNGFDLGGFYGTVDNLLVEGNLLGTDATGLQDRSDQWYIIIAEDNSGWIIRDNVISGADQGSGLEFYNMNNLTIQGNKIGVGIDGTTPIGNGFWGIRLSGGTGNIVGGLGAGEGNIIAHNSADNAGGYAGILVQTGGTATIIGNVIHSNQSHGIGLAQNSTLASISRNKIYGNLGLGIDILGNDISLNDANDADAGPNSILNFPQFDAITRSGSTVTVTGCAPAGSTVELFESDISTGAAAAGDNTLGGVSVDYGEGQTFLASFVEGSGDDSDGAVCALPADADGNNPTGMQAFSYSFTAPANFVVGDTATATTTLAASGTSEFSPVAPVAAGPVTPITVSDVSEVCRVDDGNPRDSGVPSIWWDVNSYPLPGNLEQNNTPAGSSTAAGSSPVSFGPGVGTVAKVSQLWDISGIDAATAAEARGLGEYIQMSFTMQPGYSGFLQNWTTYIRTDFAAPVHSIAVDIATQPDFSDAVNFYDGATPLAPGSTFAHTPGKGRQILRAGETYYLRYYLYGTGGARTYVDSLGVDFGPCMDFGDSTAGTGAFHDQVGTLSLRNAPDVEASAAATADATGDDVAGSDDEDGISIISMVQGQAQAVTAIVRQDSANEGYLQAWFDWNDNGSFEAGEQVASNLQSATAGSSTIEFDVTPPLSAATTPVAGRFRWSSTPGLTATGNAPDGEIEDYSVTVAPASSVAVPLLTCTSDASIFSTGYDGAGGKLPGGARDTYWDVGRGDTTGPASVANYAAGFVVSSPPPAWAASPFSNAEWISHNTDTEHQGSRDYYYRYRFDIDPSVTLSNVEINLDFLADNNVYEIYLNGAAQSAGLASVPQDTIDPYNYLGYQAANRAQTSLSSGFVSGRNELIIHLKSRRLAAGFLAQSTSSGICKRDYSDAPASYQVASHDIVDGIHLGATAPDSDFGAQTSADATGDNTNFTDDEDGVTFPALVQYGIAQIDVAVNQLAANTGYLQGWIDWNGDGDFDTGEQIASNLQSAATSGTIAVPVSVPGNAVVGSTIARFRWSTTQNLDVSTLAPDGEVEDYQVSITAGTPGVATLGSCTTGVAPWTVEWIDNAAGNYAPPLPGAGEQTALVGPKLAGAWVDAPAGSQWAYYNFPGAKNGVGNHADADLDGTSNEGTVATVTGTNDSVRLRYTLRINLADPTGVSLIGLGSTDNSVSQITVNGTPVTSAFASFNQLRNQRIDTGWVAGLNTVSIDVDSGPNLAGMLLGDCEVTRQDLSDGPASYGTAAHDIDPTLYLGATVPDADLSTQTSATADADDNDFTDDEDGVTFPALAQYGLAQIDVSMNQPAANTGYLNGWVDWNGNGTFDAGEQVAANLQSSATSGTIAVPVSVPGNAVTGTTFARFRWSSTANLDPTALAPDGEVEDYQVSISAGSAGVATLGSCSTGVAPWTVEWVDNAAENYAPPLPGTGEQLAIATPKLAGSWVNAPAGSDWIAYRFPGANNGLGLHRDADLDGNLSELGTAISGTTDDVKLRYKLMVNLADPTGVVLEGLGAADNRAPLIFINGTPLAGFTGMTYTQPVSINNGWVAGLNEVVVEVTSGPPLAGFLLGDCIITRRDYSDGPASYGVARHTFVPGFRLGATNTPEIGAVENADNAADNGVTFPPLAPGGSGTITVSVAGSGGYLNGWIDWDGNGTFDGPAEQVAADLQDFGTGTISVPVSVPFDAINGPTTARFRWSSAFDIGPTGDAVDGEVEDYTIPLGTGFTQLSGRVFLDNGMGGGMAHDATLNGTESGGLFAGLTLTDGGGTTLATPTVYADGTWTATLPQGFSGPVTVTASPQIGYRTISEATPGLPALVNGTATDGIYQFTPAAGTSYAGLDFGLVAEPLLSQNQTASLEAGQIVSLPHRYEATTAGMVSFALVDVVSNPAGTFSSALYRDMDCDGQPDATLAATVPVVAGQAICVVVRTQASGGASPTASLSYAITALTQFTGTGVSALARNDDVINGDNDNTLSLRKLVTNITAGTLESTSNTGEPGHVLQYRIIIANPSGEALTNVRVRDATPAWTALSSAIPSSVTVAPGLICSIVTPAAGGTAGYAGDLEWQCPGTLPPGAQGSLTFNVTIQ